MNKSYELELSGSTYSSSLFQSGNHDDDGGFLFPHHPPEVVDGPGEWALGSDVGTTSIMVPLDSDGQHVSHSHVYTYMYYR